MSRLIPLGPVKQRYCSECQLIASQLCTHVRDPVITTETKPSPSKNESGEPLYWPLPTTERQLEERAQARKKIDLATPDVDKDGRLVFRYVPKIKYCTSPYTRVYPHFGPSGNIFGPLERNFKDDRVYKEGSYVPRKRQPKNVKTAKKEQKTKKSKKAPKEKLNIKVEEFKSEPESDTDQTVYIKPEKCAPKQFRHSKAISDLRKTWHIHRQLYGRGVFKPKVETAPAPKSKSDEIKRLFEVPDVTESAGQA